MSIPFRIVYNGQREVPYPNFMREIRIYQQQKFQIGLEFYLDEIASQHVGVVLKMKVGDKVTLFNGDDDYEAYATIHSMQKKRVGVLVLELAHISKESPLKIHLVQAISKGSVWSGSYKKLLN